MAGNATGRGHGESDARRFMIQVLRELCVARVIAQVLAFV